MTIKLSIEQISYQLRKLSLIMTTEAGSGHATSAMSCADIIAVLFTKFLKPTDHFILSKGHAVPVVYAMYYLLGKISYEELLTYRDFDSNLEGHPTPLFKYTEAATGSLGNGLGIALGYALKAKEKSYVILGDSEMAEGSIWEAINLAGHYKTKNLVAIIDANNLGQQTKTINFEHAEKFAKQITPFGWETKIIDGHSIEEIEEALAYNTDKPYMIIAKTHKGSGVIELEDKQGWHGKAVSKQDLNRILKELADRYKQKFEPIELENKKTFLDTISNEITPSLRVSICSLTTADRRNAYQGKPSNSNYNENCIEALKKDLVSTREAYGETLKNAGETNNKIYCLDAEVSNSTYSVKFKEAFPERFIECFIAEQNMVNMAIGLSNTNKIIFASTFAAFWSRAFDQLRMAAIGRVPLRLCGSHAGVSIGQDGPSQMGLEDIAIMRTLPQSIVLYPCDQNSTYSLVNLMVNYNDGISYLRTTRAKTPVIYDTHAQFIVGGSHTLIDHEKPDACIITAGITVHFALEAAEKLSKQNIKINVLDAYSIKPLDKIAIKSQLNKTNKLLVVEDHYQSGGLGEAVFSLVDTNKLKTKHNFVSSLPKSGSPSALLNYYKLDTDGIMNSILDLLD